MRFLQKDKINKVFLVLSDLHLGAGTMFENKKNHLEEFHYDKELVEFLKYYSSGDYANKDVELILNGDVFDFLAVPFVKYFDDEFWSEKAALDKFKIILEAHGEVLDGFIEFIKIKKKKIVYMLGNHDAEMAFPSLREYLLSKIPEDLWSNFEIFFDHSGEYRPVEGVSIKHGHEYDVSNRFKLSKSIVEDDKGEKYFIPPWGSYYVIRVLNKFKSERSDIDAVRPVKKFIINGLIYDTLFTLRFAFSSLYYFFMVRFIYFFKQSKSLNKFIKHIKRETILFKDYESLTQDLLRYASNTKVLIMGHTHLPTFRTYQDGSMFINTGTWTDMHYMDFSKSDQGLLLTYAQINILDKKIKESEEQDLINKNRFDHLDISLNSWKGTNELPFNEF